MKLKKTSLAFAALAGLALSATSANADLYWSGTGAWDTTSTNWGTVSGGPYNSSMWSNGESAFLEGTQGTLTLGANFSLDQMAIGGNTASGTNYVVGNTAGNNTLTFTGTKTLTVSRVDVTINTGVAGSPALNYNSRPDNGADMLLNPGSLTQNYSGINVVKDPVTQRNALLTLSGTSTGNSTGDITWSAGAQQLVVDKQGSGTWEIGSFTPSGAARFRTTGAGGNLIVTGNITTTHEIDIRAGTLTSAGNLGVTRGGVEHVRISAGASMSPNISGIASISTITIQNDHLTWNSDNTTAGMLFDLSSIDSMSDLINITRTGSAANEGGFFKGTGTAFLFDFTGGLAGETYTLVNFDSTTFTSATEFGVLPASGVDGSFTLNSNSLQFTVVPEPSSALLGALGFLALLRRRR